MGVQYPQVERFGPSEAVTERISGISETPATKHVNFILVTNGGGGGGGRIIVASPHPALRENS